MHPVTQEFPTVYRVHRPQNYERTFSASLSASFHRGGLEPIVTLLALVEGFGPGWSAEEVCQLTLDALRDRFLVADDSNPLAILMAGLQDANAAVYERASEYSALGEVGGYGVLALLTGGRSFVVQLGKDAAYLRI